MVNAILDHIDDCGILCVPIISQCLAIGKHFRASDVHKCICGIDYSIWIRYSVHAASHAEILLFHGIYSLFSLDHRTAFFLSDASVLCRTCLLYTSRCV